jgi:hypothetical protein
VNLTQLAQNSDYWQSYVNNSDKSIAVNLIILHQQMLLSHKFCYISNMPKTEQKFHEILYILHAMHQN